MDNSQFTIDLQDLKVHCSVYEQRLSKAEKEIEQLHAENKAIYEINTNVKILAEGMSVMKKDVLDVKEGVKHSNERSAKLDEKFDAELDKIKIDVNDIKNNPNKVKAEWWDKIMWLIVGGVVSAGVTALIAALWK